MRLSDRLEAVLEMITPTADGMQDDGVQDDGVQVAGTLADIGCDHGYISIEAVRRGLVSRAVASDIGAGPIAIARENIERAGLSESIRTLQADGLDGLKESPDIIVIAGMGGMLMKNILKRGECVTRSARQLILSPQSDLEEFRKYLLEASFAIDSESCVKDDGKYYFVISARHSGAEATKGSCDEPGYTACDCKYGKAEHFTETGLKNREELMLRDLAKYKAIIEGLASEKSPSSLARTQEINYEIEIIEGALHEI